METTQSPSYVFIIFCDKPWYEESLKKLFEINTDLKDNLVLLVGSPRQQQKAVEIIRTLAPEMKYDISSYSYEAFSYLRAAFRRSFGETHIAPICTPLYGARLMAIFSLMHDLKNIKLRQHNKYVTFMFYSISGKDQTSAFITKYFYSSERGIMCAKKCAKWLRASPFHREREKIIRKLNRNYKHQ